MFLGLGTFRLRCCLCRVREISDFIKKCLNLCSEDERRSYGFGTTWGWVINDRIFIFGWTTPLSVCIFSEASKLQIHCNRTEKSNQHIVQISCLPFIQVWNNMRVLNNKNFVCITIPLYYTQQRMQNHILYWTEDSFDPLTFKLRMRKNYQSQSSDQQKQLPAHNISVIKKAFRQSQSEKKKSMKATKGVKLLPEACPLPCFLQLCVSVPSLFPLSLRAPPGIKPATRHRAWPHREKRVCACVCVGFVPELCKGCLLTCALKPEFTLSLHTHTHALNTTHFLWANHLPLQTLCS